MAKVTAYYPQQVYTAIPQTDGWVVTVEGITTPLSPSKVPATLKVVLNRIGRMTYPWDDAVIIRAPTSMGTANLVAFTNVRGSWLWVQEVIPPVKVDLDWIDLVEMLGG